MEIVVFSRVLTLALSRYGFRSMVAIGPASTRIRRATSLKVRMHASLLCGDSTSRIVNEHGVQKVEPIVIPAVNKSPSTNRPLTSALDGSRDHLGKDGLKSGKDVTPGQS